MALPKITAPKYEMKIPSTGKMVTYRPYLVKEEKILMIAMETGDESAMIRAIKDLLKSCVEDDQFDPNNITTFDMEYMFTLIRSRSTGETATVKIPCTKCEFSNEVDINLSKIRIDGLTDKNKHRDIMLSDTIGMRIRYPTLGGITDVAFSSASSPAKKDGNEEKFDVDQAFGLIEKSIEYVFDGDQIYDFADHSRDEINEFIDSLSSKHMLEIRDFIESMPSAVVNTEFDCIKCRHHNTLELRGMQSFLN